MSSIQEEISYMAQKVATAACFALLRRPGSATYEVLIGNEQPERLSSLDDIGGRQGWIAAPFGTSTAAPIIFFSPTVRESRSVLPLSDFSTKDISVSAIRTEKEEKADYRRGFDLCLSNLREGKVKKVVYARRRQFELAVKADTGVCIALFLKACALQRHSYVSMWSDGCGGYWIVSTPEVLLSGSTRDGFRTMALAGTMLWSEAIGSVRWSAKNKEEQALVAAYIRNRLEGIGCSSRLYGPYPVRAGNVAHLRTDISFKLSESVSPLDVISALHPTPAVCGLPPVDAMAVIADAEDFQRRYYAGFSGLLDYEGSTDLYVSLRCMELSAGVASLYAGGGLLAESYCEDEWTETCRKMRAMEQLLNYER